MDKAYATKDTKRNVVKIFCWMEESEELDYLRIEKSYLNIVCQMQITRDVLIPIY